MEEGSLFQRMKQIFHEDEMDEEMQKEAAGLIRNIFRYMDKDAKDIMTHRKNIVAIDGDWSLENAFQDFRSIRKISMRSSGSFI